MKQIFSSCAKLMLCIIAFSASSVNATHQHTQSPQERELYGLMCASVTDQEPHKSMICALLESNPSLHERCLHRLLTQFRSTTADDLWLYETCLEHCKDFTLASELQKNSCKNALECAKAEHKSLLKKIKSEQALIDILLPGQRVERPYKGCEAFQELQTKDDLLADQAKRQQKLATAVKVEAQLETLLGQSKNNTSN